MPEGSEPYAFFLEIEKVIERSGYERSLQSKTPGGIDYTELRLDNKNEVVAGFSAVADRRSSVSLIWKRKRRDIFVYFTDLGTVAIGDEARPEVHAQFETLRRAIIATFWEGNISVNSP